MEKDDKERQIAWLGRQLFSGKISRREFIGRTVALGATTALATSLAGEIAKAAPKHGGHVRVGQGHGSTTDSLDPATYENGYTAVLNYAIHNHLAEIGQSGNLEPELAESWEASSDATTWTFKLRKGVEFHNGKTMTAEDVVASINHHRGEETKSAAKPLLTQVEDIKADGDDTVVVRLTGGNADFPYVISDYHVAILPTKDGGVDWQSGTGTGPFKLQGFEPGVRADYVRNPNYFKGDKPYFDSMEQLSIIDVTARTNALTTGEIDVMDRCDLKTVHLLKRSPNLQVKETVGTLHYTFPMRTDTPPFDNNDVRLALKHAINREEIVQKVLRGFGSLGNDHPISPSVPFFAKDLPQRGYDPDKAKFHLKKAGAEGLAVQLSAADAAFAGAVDAAVLYKEHAAAAGINIEIVREPNDGYWSNVWMQKPWCACYWGGRPTQDWMFSTAYVNGADWNDTFWKHDKFNELVIQARAELDQNKRAQMYAEMQAIIRDEGGVVVPMFANYVFAMSAKIEHGEMQGNWDLDGDKFFERWWFA